jgi:NAD(P)-dependent dehydrogenase (short-subunit alcohol dehydrogenase family)
MAEWERQPGFDLSGKRALVVGFANPAGSAIALALAEAGADVATASSTLDGDEIMVAKQCSKAVAKLGRATFSQGWDVTLPTNVQVGLKQLMKQFGMPSVLVYNADFQLQKPIEKVTDAEFGRVLQVNLAGAFYAARSFVRELPAGTPGRLVFVTSLQGERGLGNTAAYSAAKAGVSGLTMALSQELAPRQVTVNCMAPGWMDWSPGRGPDDPGENRLLRYIPMRRFGQGDELAGLAVLLASDAGGYLNGQVFHIDGGLTTHM